MSDVVIRSNFLAKRYTLGAAKVQKTFRESIVDGVKAPLRAVRRRVRGATTAVGNAETTLWALSDVSFEVKRGEAVGVIGRNGAGKSTLLKILSRITEPTGGWVDIEGRVGSLLEVGTGFHPELTGRENIYLNGAILGMRRGEVRRKFDEMVAFAEVEKFLDTPVKRYSSGMYTRLAFAVAAHLEPEILVVDEVLAVGDAAFQKKCLGKMGDVAGEGRTVIFVSHNMAAIRALCPRSIVLQKGKVIADGRSSDVIEKYVDENLATGAVAAGEDLDRCAITWAPQGPMLHCHEVAILDRDCNPRDRFGSDEPVTLAARFRCNEVAPDLQVVWELVDIDGNALLRTQLSDDPAGARIHRFAAGEYLTRVVLPRDSFGERKVYVNFHLVCQNSHHLTYKQVLSFHVEFRGYNDNLSVHSKDAWFRPQLPWQVESDPPPRVAGTTAASASAAGEAAGEAALTA